MRLVPEVKAIEVVLPLPRDADMKTLSQVWASVLRVHLAYRFKESTISIILKDTEGHADPSIVVDDYTDSADVAAVKALVDESLSEAMADVGVNIEGEVHTETERMKITRAPAEHVEAPVITATVQGKEFS